jgi:hypothetical protein
MATEKRLIDANALMKYINQNHSYAGLPMAAHVLTMELLTYAPTVDVGDAVVRCGKCKWYDPESACCKFWHGSRSPSHYCGEGKVKDNELV